MAVVISDRLLQSSDRLLDAEPDDQLVRLVQTGHEAAFAAIVRRYERELQAHARRLSADGRGEDAVQQAFLNAFAALQSGREVRHLRGWLHQILRHEVTRARVPVDAPLEATVACGETLEDTVARRATAQAALAELSALPDRQRDALLGTAVFGFPRAHVARTMGLSEGAVRQLVHRARLRLREAATAVIPFPLVKLFGAARSGIDANPEAALGAGTAASAAASGGLAIKVGALLASGALATGIAVTQASPSPRHAGAAAVHPHQLPHAGATRHLSPAAAAAAPAFASDRLRSGDHGVAAGEDGRADGGRGRLSGTRSQHNGPGAGREGGRGQDGAPVGRDDGGSERSPGGAAADGDHGGGPSSSSNSGSGSGSGSGSDSTSSGGGRSGSGSGSGHSGGSGASSGSTTGSTGSGSGDGASSSDSGAGSGHSSGGGNAGSTGGGADTTASPGSSGTASAATATGDGTSGDHDTASGGGQDNGNVVSLGSDSSQTPSSGSGSGGGKENSRESRDLSGSLDSSSS